MRNSLSPAKLERATLGNMNHNKKVPWSSFHRESKFWYDASSNKPGRYGGEEGGSRGLCQATLSGKPTWDQLVHMLILMHTVITYMYQIDINCQSWKQKWKKKVLTWCLQRLWPNRQSRLMQRTANMWFIIIFIIFIIIIYTSLLAYAAHDFDFW